MRCLRILSLALMLSFPATLDARPVTRETTAIHLDVGSDEPERFPGLVNGLSSSVFLDTVRYGGTYWAPDSLRWEALRDSTWTFDTGVGSAFGATGPNKPAGYHTRMEGWYGVDETLPDLAGLFRRSGICKIDGLYSMWAGLTQAEADSLCYASGQGYGNNLDINLQKTFTYPGSGNITFSYDYAVDAESAFDYARVLIDTTGTGAQPDVELVVYTGIMSGNQMLTLTRGVTLRSTPGPFVIKFQVTSDPSYSDEDGLDPTVCGHTIVDDITLGGAVTDVADFEAGDGGWAQPPPPLTGVGDYSNIVHTFDLPAPDTFCACGLQDSVLVFNDLTQQHPLGIDNLAVSPWIDLARGGDAARSGKGIFFDFYADLSLFDGFHFGLLVRYPEVCPITGLVRLSPWKFTGLFALETPTCTQAGQPRFLNLGGAVPAMTGQVQIAVEMANTCFAAWGCTDLSNNTPWIDNVSFAVFGPITAPQVTFSSLSDRLQDNFATDGTLDGASTGRLDIRLEKSAASVTLADTIVASGDGGNTEVRLVFHVRSGPFTSAPALAAWATQWKPETGIGPSWYSARMDTAEQNGVKSAGKWMSTFHEADPGFMGTDRTLDPMNPTELENEILPDAILTPGSRVDYFLASRYIPPDPRNVGGENWFIWPDTTGGIFLEAEILPSSYGADSTWNCVLYVDRHEGTDAAGAVLEEAGLAQVLGSGGSNAEGTRYDRWDGPILTSLGRPAGATYGASLDQLAAYRTIAWHSGGFNRGLTASDVAVLNSWLAGPVSRGLWMAGDDVAIQATQGVGTVASITDFLNNSLGVLFSCDRIWTVNCPSGSPFDDRICLPVATDAGAAFSTAAPANLNIGNCGLSSPRSFDRILRNTAAPGTAVQLNYLKNATAPSPASVTTDAPTYRAVFDAFSVSRLRTNTGDPANPADCADVTAALLRTADVLDWLDAAVVCPDAISDVPEGGAPPPPTLYPALGRATPNPLTASTRIAFTNVEENGHVRIEIFDVAGRLVRTLLDAPQPAGKLEIGWDGANDRGTAVSGGLYFYRMTAGRYVAARKVIVVE